MTVPPSALATLARWMAACPPGAAVILACLAVHRLPRLPDRPVVAGLAGFGLALLLVRGHWPRLVRAWRGVAGGPVGVARRAFARAGAAGVLCLACALLAAAFTLEAARRALQARLPAAWEGREWVVVGVVDEMPAAGTHGWRTRLRIERCESMIIPTPRGAGKAGATAASTEPGTVPDVCPTDAVVRLSWPAPAPPRRGGAAVARPTPEQAPFSPGERWRLSVRLKRPLAAQNPHLFDAELRALAEGVQAVGSVRDGVRTAVRPERLPGLSLSPRHWVERARARLRDTMARALATRSASVRGVLIALVVGDQGAVPGADWERFNRTGVGHLMSISGLHITMLAGLAMLLTRRVWRSPLRLPGRGSAQAGTLVRWVSAPRAAWLVGVTVAFGYSALAGWGLPAQRTCWMLAVAGFAMLHGRARHAAPTLCTAAAIVCVADPWAPMAAGFWLSFAAVAAIVWHGSVRRLPTTAPAPASFSASVSALLPRWRTMLAEASRSQVAATVSLLPLGVLFFSSVSLVSPVANAFAIPLVSALITPLALAGGFIGLAHETAGSGVLALAAWLTEALMVALRACDALAWAAVAVPAPTLPALLLATLAAAVLLAPWPVPWRGLALAGLLPLLFAPTRAPRPGELWLTAFDVGQGMAMLVETPEGRLLFDAGPSHGPDSDAGARVIGPYLRARGIRHLQALVVSHRDSDHAGGAGSLLRQVSIDWFASSLEDSHPLLRAAPRHFRCELGQQWRWGEVEFTWLHPSPGETPGARRTGNARSCVLRVRSPAGSALLAGDIEAAQEAQLLSREGAEGLRADVLLVPHHGSASSSTSAFVQAVAPTWAVFQVGYRNRFGHPAPAVLARYQDAGIDVLRTDHHGAIQLRLRAGGPSRLHRQRLDEPHYWRLRADPGALAGEDEIGEDPAR